MNSTATRLLVGGMIVLFGIVLLFDQLGINYGFGKLWPLFIVFAGIFMIVKNPRSMFPGFFVLLIGVVWQLNTLNILNVNIWTLWPVFIIFAGLSILIGRKDRHDDWTSSKEDSGFITSNATFWGDERVVKGEFKGANLTATFGGIKLDLRKATLSSDVKIEINASFAGIEILLPDNVKVVNKTSGFVGEVSDKSSRDFDSDAKTITITGSAMFGGVDIK